MDQLPIGRSGARPFPVYFYFYSETNFFFFVCRGMEPSLLLFLFLDASFFFSFALSKQTVGGSRTAVS